MTRKKFDWLPCYYCILPHHIWLVCSQYKVMQRQLVLLHQAFAAYFAGNHASLEVMVEELKEKVQENQRHRHLPEWLEELPSSEEQ